MVKCTWLTIYKCTILWHYVFSKCCTAHCYYPFPELSPPFCTWWNLFLQICFCRVISFKWDHTTRGLLYLTSPKYAFKRATWKGRNRNRYYASPSTPLHPSPCLTSRTLCDCLWLPGAPLGSWSTLCLHANQRATSTLSWHPPGQP